MNMLAAVAVCLSFAAAAQTDDAGVAIDERVDSRAQERQTGDDVSTGRSPSSKPAVAVSVEGAHEPGDEERIRGTLASSYRIVPPAEAEFFVDVEVDVDTGALTVEVRDGEGVLSRQRVSSRGLELDLIVWLVVRDALGRAELVPAPLPPPPAPQPPAPAPPAATTPAAATLAVLTVHAEPRALARAARLPAFALGVAGVAASASNAAAPPELGARAFLSSTLARVAPGALGERLHVAVDAGYRAQSTPSPRVLAVHAFPVGACAGVDVVGGGESGNTALAIALDARVEAAPKWVALGTAAAGAAAAAPASLVELAAGPVLRVVVPFGDDVAALTNAVGAGAAVVEIGVAGKLYRQAFLVDGAAGPVEETPWRAHVALGLEWRWG